MAATAVVLLAVPAFASEPDRSCTRDLAGRLPAPTAALLATLDVLFEREATPPADTPAGVSSEFTTMETLIVRVKDGKPVVACVDTKEAAVRFLTAPLAEIGAQTAEDK